MLVGIRGKRERKRERERERKRERRHGVKCLDWSTIGRELSRVLLCVRESGISDNRNRRGCVCGREKYNMGYLGLHREKKSGGW